MNLLAELRAVLDRVDPVPPHLAEAATFPPPTDHTLLTWLSDSAMAAPPGMRGTGDSRSLRFTTDHTTVDLRLETVHGAGVRALGLVHPSRGGEVRISWPHGGTTAHVDAIGWFRADTLPTGPLRFTFRHPGLPDLTTGWFVQ